MALILRSGIVNHGATCFINAALQCLASCPQIINFIEQHAEDDTRLVETIKKYEFNKLPLNAKAIETTINATMAQHIDQLKAVSTEDREEFVNYIKYVFPLLTQLKNKKLDTFIYFAFKDIIAKLLSQTSGPSPSPINPDLLLRLLRERAKQSGMDHLFGGAQNDPHEFLIYLLDVLHESKSHAIKTAYKYNTGNTADEQYNIIKKKIFDDFKQRYEKGYTSLILAIYYYNLSCVACSKCGHKVYNVTPNNNMCLPMPTTQQQAPQQAQQQAPQQPLTIYDCLDKLFDTEKLDGYTCDKCTNTTDNIMYKYIVLSPQLLIIEFKRYEMHGGTSGMASLLLGLGIGNPAFRKNDTPILYPDTLDITRYITCNDLNTQFTSDTTTTHHDKATKYKLVGVICHVGSLSGGHYYSYCRDTANDSVWHHCNDEHTRIVPLSAVLNLPNAYMLFYSKI